MLLVRAPPSPSPSSMTAIATPAASGDPLRRAEALFQTALRLHLAGDTAAAEAQYERVLALAPQHPEVQNNYATLLLGRGETARAEAMLRDVCARHITYASAHYNLGLFLTNCGRDPEALPFLARAIEIEPHNAEWLNTLGNLHNHALRYADALPLYERAVAAVPVFHEAWNNLGVALRGLLRRDEAIAAFERSVSLRPDYTPALSNLAYVLKECRRFDESCATFERALALSPRDPVILGSYSVVYMEQGRFEEALALAQRALEADPDAAGALNAMGNCLVELGRADEAVAYYDRVRAVDPREPHAAYNRALIHLERGEFEQGWPLFEARLRLQVLGCDLRHIDGALWGGEPLDGRRILVHTEQGIGDSLQFIRYARVLKERGAAEVIVEALPHLCGLLSRAEGVDRVIGRGDPLPPFDVRVYLLSIPGLCGTTHDTIPARVPYLAARRSAATERLQPGGALRVGLVWSGNVIQQRNAIRSAPLDALAPLFEIPGVELYGLQKGGPERELAALHTPIIDLSDALIELDDTAAVIDELDLVITVCTSMAHLAGGLACPTWVALASVADWRWHRDPDGSAWYPTARLFRQEAAGDWNGVFRRMAAALDRYARTTPHRRGVRVSTTLSTPVPDSHAAPAGADQAIVTVASAERTADEQPLFTLATPIRRLADARCFEEFEAELTGVGWDRETRQLVAELAPEGALVVDLDVGLGSASLATAATTGGRVAVLAVTDDSAAIDGLMAAAEVAGVSPQLVCLPTIPTEEVVSLLQPSSVWIRLGDAVRWEGVRAALRADTIAAQVDIVTWRTATDASEALATELREGGFAILSLAWRDAELELGDAGAGPVAAAFSARALERLHGLRIPTAAAEVPPAWAPLLVLDWAVGMASGWGIYGAHLAQELVRRGTDPLLLGGMDLAAVEDGSAGALTRARAASDRVRSALAADATAVLEVDGILLQALGNGLASTGAEARVRAARRVGAVFFEDSCIDEAMRTRAAEFDLIVAGSSWNAELLRTAGILNVVTALQGVDTTRWFPRRVDRRADRFVIFSGGKLEYRKGQDLVIAAFRRFQACHPEAILLTAWHNHWPHTITDLDLAGHVCGRPTVRGTDLLVTDWLEENGVSRRAVRDLGLRRPAELPALIAAADVALFPNRCEGGTNLVAMECIAAGIPTVISANTGHLDLVALGGCHALERQSPVRQPTQFYRATSGWGESDVDEMVDALERIHADRNAALREAARGAELIRAWSWPRQTSHLIALLHEHFTASGSPSCPH